jgi:hypothetical protein
MAAKQGPDVLFCMPDRTKRIALVTVVKHCGGASCLREIKNTPTKKMPKRAPRPGGNESTVVRLVQPLPLPLGCTLLALNLRPTEP